MAEFNTLPETSIDTLGLALDTSRHSPYVNHVAAHNEVSSHAP